MNSQIALIQNIDALLPQTQCGLCGHRDGCLPYAKSIAEGEEANKCVPGGQPVADALAALLKRPQLLAEESVWPIQSDGRPQRMKAIIREDECIGCTKCISACPVDAIVGSGKLMHSVLTDWCTGCELCLPPCPVDCIDLVDWPAVPSAEQQQYDQQQLRQRYQARNQREQQRSQDPLNTRPIVAVATSSTFSSSSSSSSSAMSPAVKMSTQDPINMVQQATLRSQIGKLQRQLRVQPNPIKQAEFEQLQQQLSQMMEPLA